MTVDNDYFKDRVAVILGASNEGGSGWSVAEALADRGTNVVVAARRAEQLAVLADRTGGTAVTCDADSEEDIARLADTAIETYGKVDIAVIAVAGLPLGTVADTSEQVLLAGVRRFYLSHVFFARHMARVMGRREPGDDASIIHFLSISSTTTIVPLVPAAAPQAASACLVEYAALEFAPMGIRVNSIKVGYALTPLTQKAYTQPGMAEAIQREIPLGRMGLPDDMVNAVLWLAGPSFITGAHLPISGGHQLTRAPRADELPGGSENYAQIVH